MQKIAIYGCGKVGKAAYGLLKDMFDIVFFVDRNAGIEENNSYQGVPIKEPKELLNYKEIMIVIAAMSCYQEEILEDIRKLGINNPNICLFNINLERAWNEARRLEKQLDDRTIDLGNFLMGQDVPLECKELTFITGGSGVLDYFFLKQIGKEFHCKSYLEIGTYIGESINILTDECERLYSITAPLDSPCAPREWFKKIKRPDYTERLAQHEKIVHFYEDSKLFDYSQIPNDIDLFFIDGDHRYDAVYSDTKNIFSIRKEESIVVWHDFKIGRNQYNAEVVQAVADVLGDDFRNVYVTDNNVCGIYLPDCYKDRFKTIINEYTESGDLYVYDTMLRVHIK